MILQERDIIVKLPNGNIRRTISKFEKGVKTIYNLDRYLKMYTKYTNEQIEHIKNNKEQYFTILN
jgi:hypothetical protein